MFALYAAPFDEVRCSRLLLADATWHLPGGRLSLPVCCAFASPRGVQWCLLSIPKPLLRTSHTHAHLFLVQVLILDGDSAPLQDPAPLFGHPAFLRHGVMAWPDNLCERVMLYRQVVEWY